MNHNIISFFYSTNMSPTISYLLVFILLVSFGKSIAEIVLLFEAHRNNLDELLISKDKIIYHLPFVHDNMNDPVSNETQRMMIFTEDTYIV